MAPRLFPTAEKLTRLLLNRAGLASRWVEAGGARLHVYDGPGQGTLPTVVLLHGLSASASSYAALAVRLFPHVRRIVVPELPGHGFTDHPGFSVTPDVLNGAMVDGLDALLDERAIVVGNSLGGALALHYASRRPGRVRGLALLSPAGARLPEEEWREVRRAFHVTSRREALALIDRIYPRRPWVVALMAHEFPELMSRRAVREILETATNDHAVAPDALACLTMPVLLLWGRSERLLPSSALAYFREHLPAHAVIEEPFGFGHTPQVDATERVATRLLAFARRADDAAATGSAPGPAAPSGA